MQKKGGGARWLFPKKSLVGFLWGLRFTVLNLRLRIFQDGGAVEWNDLRQVLVFTDKILRFEFTRK